MLQVQTLPNTTPTISKIHLSSKIAVTFELIMSLNVLTDLKSPNFHQLGPLGRVGLVVAKCVVCLFV